MKRSLYFFMGLAAVSLAIVSCDNGNADVTIFDSPPAIELVKPKNFTVNNFTLKANLLDGASAKISSSPLQGGAWRIINASDVVSKSGEWTVSGVLAEQSEAITNLAAGEYTLIIDAEDSNGNTASDTTEFTVINSFGIIGSSTPGGWGSDTDMIASAEDVDVRTVTLTLGTGEVKFRANDDWVLDWGGAGLEGTAAFKGANIAITSAGTYKVTFNLSTGQYSMIKQ
jgi:hypothetical protein